MQYLLTLKNDFIKAFDSLTADKVNLFIVNGKMDKTSNSISYIGRFLLIDCRLANSFSVIFFIKKWFKNKNLDIPDISFNSKVIDDKTYNLEIDIGLTDDLILSSNGTDVQVCHAPVWSDKLGTFIKGNIAVDSDA